LWGCHYLVSEDDIERLILFIESNATQQTRTLITFNNENNVIEIPGTEVLSQSGGVFCRVTKAILFFVF
jgi:hypothetical protein